MDEAGLVNRLEARQELRGDLSGLLEIERPPRLKNVYEGRSEEVLKV